MDKIEDLRTVTEIRLLATALMSDDELVRTKILEFTYYTSNIGVQLSAKLKKAFEKYPNGDYSVYLSTLDLEEQKTIVLAMETAVSQTVDELRVDSVLENLKETAISEHMKKQVSELFISDDYTADDLRQIVSETEKADFSLDPIQKYLDEYGNPTEHIKTGFKILDDMLNGGMVRGTVGTIGARPSVGKTTFAVNVAENNPDKKILFFSLEMSCRMVYDKLIASVGNIDYKNAVNHDVGFDTVKAVLDRHKNFTVIDNVATAEEMTEIIRRIKPDIVFIDYIQIVYTKKQYDVIRQRIDYISQLLKRTAKQTNCCIICLSQLARSAKEKATMSALKESGGLEQDSDYIILIERPYVLDKSDKEILPSDTKIIVDKNKFGSTGEIKFYFEGKYQRFTENEEPMGHIKKSDKNEDTLEDLPF